MLHCRLSLQRRGLICPQFSCFTLKITTPSILKEEKDLFSLGETGPKKNPIHKPTPSYLDISLPTPPLYTRFAFLT